MRYVTIRETNKLIDQLRALTPNRPLSFSESLNLASNQSFHVRLWLEAGDARINLAWLLNQRAVPVHQVPRYKLGENNSGLTTDEVAGRMRMFINQNEPHVRQRFTLAHEFKHVIDFHVGDRLYARLGSGNAKRHHDQVEAICNHFAATLLMPTGLFKSAWFRTQDIALIANLFHVSHEAVSTRLDKLGMRDQPQPKSRTYFRHSSWLPEPGEMDLDLAGLNPLAPVTA